MIGIIQLRDLPPEDKKALFKEALRQARVNLLNAQMIYGPTDERYTKLEELIGPLEDMITKKD